MKLNDIFNSQIEENSSMLYVVLKEGDHECLYRYKIADKDNIVDSLKDYKYVDTRLGIPRFEKKAKRNAAKTA
jgi:CRISPR/Cas system CMR-associated protein Cmr1 (group 7 of RAMP superfamily)